MAYSDAFVSEALIVLAVNKYDYKKTADDLGVSEKTLRRWDKNAPKKGVPELLERAIERMLIHIPKDWSGHDWAVAVGILIDKYQLMRGEPTNRVENIFKALETLPDDELDRLLTEFQTAASRGLIVDASES